MPFLTWAGTDQWRAESVHVEGSGDGFTARGVQLGVDPLPYRLDYHLVTADRWLTRTLEVSAAGDGWRRTVRLARDPRGQWTCAAESEGRVDLPEPGAGAGALAAALAGAVDSDLGLS